MPDRASPRLAGGLWCHEVLELLPDVLSGELPAAAQARVQAHLADCDWCTRFGGDYAATVAALRAQRPAEAPPADLAARLLDRL